MFLKTISTQHNFGPRLWNPKSKVAAWAIAFYVAIVTVISIGSLIFFIHAKRHFISSDSYYYLSVADSIIESGQALDITSIPARPLKTPQNGIVFLFTILRKSGQSRQNCLLFITCFSYLAYLSSAYPFYKLAIRAGCKSRIMLAGLLGAYLGAWHIYKYQLLPINDGIFNFLSIWLIYCIVVWIDTLNAGKEPKRYSLLLYLIILVFSAVLVHFRLNVVVILGAAVVSAILTKKLRLCLCLISAMCCSIGSLLCLYAFVDTTRMAGENTRIWSQLMERIPENILDLFWHQIPSLLLGDTGSVLNIFYCVFLIATVYVFISGLRRQEFIRLFLSTLCIASVCFTLLLPFRPYRYFLYTFGFFYLCALLFRYTRPIGAVFILGILLSSASVLLGIRPDRVGLQQKIWLHIHNNGIKLANPDSLLVSKKSRFTYFFLDKRSVAFNTLSLDKIKTQNRLYLLGPRNVLDLWLAKIMNMTQQEHYTFRQRNLTADYNDSQGNAIIELYDFMPYTIETK